MTDYLRALGGGAVLGLAAALALAIHGRIAGVCGIISRVFEGDGGRVFRVGFIAGVVATGAILAALTPSVFGTAVRSTPMLGVAGLLVGIGTTVSNGCTAGHGICGVGRFSPRSIVATATFVFTGMVTVAVLGGHS